MVDIHRKTFLDINAMAALPVFLSADLALPVDKQQGQEWVAAQAYQVAQAMWKESEKVTNASTVSVD